MIFNIIVIGEILGITWVWARSGFFSALLHLLCTIVAGAFAFAVWEPLAYALLGAAPSDGFFKFFENVVWTVSLLGPFAISLLLLRAFMDKIAPGNLRNTSAVDMAGGGVLGFVSAYLTTGVIVIALGFLRMGGVMGFKPVEYDSGGSVVRASGLWIQAESVTANFYGMLSDNTLRTSRSLDELYPDLSTAGYALQLGYKTKTRNAIRPEDFDVTRGFVVGQAQDLPLRDLIAYDDGAGQQQVMLLDREVPGAGKLYGYTISFGPGAKEDFGQVVLTAGQLRLLVENTSGDEITVHPHAVVSQADPDNAEGMGRWRLNAPDLPVSSVSTASEVNMTFEFFVPSGYTPAFLYVKNVRTDVSGIELAPFDSASTLVSAIARGDLGGGTARVENIENEFATTVSSTGSNNRRGPADGLEISDQAGFVFQSSQKGSLNVDSENRIVSGNQKFFQSEISGRNDVSRELRIERFFVDSRSVMVQLDVSQSRPGSLLGRAVRAASNILPPQLVDTNGVAHPAIGYIYRDKDYIEIRIDPGNPIRSLSELRDKYGVALTEIRDDQELELLFYVSKGVQIRSFTLGNRGIIEFSPPVEAK